MKRTLLPLLLMLAITFSCKQDLQESKISNKLRGAIDHFLTSIQNDPNCSSTKVRILTIGIHNVGGSSVVRILNAYPRISRFKLVGYAMHKGCEVYIVGDYNDELFDTDHSLISVVARLNKMEKEVGQHPCEVSYLYAHNNFTIKAKRHSN
ncbi:hypothetical protein LJY25_03540 [Hymenobacter sp. BT175]|uniref:hypothetical protein n=1 Tax=Hymenobacter translucens TaxID=2886507 RepID=UPI001D0DE038|nr:hypothetical protein [Hymenobacter translucens]MCC2545504.1 hypothetical protein [Hymenobacter translucens]